SKPCALKYLQNLGVEVMLNTMLKDYNGNEVILADKEAIQTQTLLWAAGIKPNRIGGLEEDRYAPNGRIVVDDRSEVKGCPYVYALGDISLMTQEAYPKGHPQVAQVAIQQAVCLAHNLHKIEEGKERKAFQYKDLGSMATVGRKLAVVDLPFIKFQGIL